MKKDTPIGYSDFRQIREENRYYVDKTAMVRPVVKGALITLLCRPRRFGKTLNLSMLRYFFDRTGDYAHLFEGMAVQQDAEMMQHFGRYPVVTLSFKDARGGSYADAFTDLCRLLYHEWLRNDLQGDLREPLLGALLEGDVLTFEEQLSDFALRVFSFYDADRTRSEHFYHAFLLGLLVRLDTRYVIRSNMESGRGRYDICLIPRDATKKGVVMEIKPPNLRRNETLEQALAVAVEQMARQRYDTELAAHGVRDVLRLAVAVSGKDVRVEEVEM